MHGFSGHFNREEKALAEVMPVRETIRGRLERERRELTNRTTEIDEALSLLERNPDIERLMNLLR